MSATLYPPFKTLPLCHPRRRAAERSFGATAFRKISWVAAGEIGACASTVADAMTSFGGEPVLGLLIHYWPGMFIEGLPHYAWRRPDGALIDLTAKYPTDLAKHSVFAPFNAAENMALGPGKYFPLGKAPEVAALIDAGLRQARTRREIEDAIRRRIGRDGKFVQRFLDFANASETATLRFHEERVALEIRNCMAVDVTRRRSN